MSTTIVKQPITVSGPVVYHELSDNLAVQLSLETLHLIAEDSQIDVKPNSYKETGFYKGDCFLEVVGPIPKDFLDIVSSELLTTSGTRAVEIAAHDWVKEFSIGIFLANATGEIKYWVEAGSAKGTFVYSLPLKEELDIELALLLFLYYVRFNHLVHRIHYQMMGDSIHLEVNMHSLNET